MKDLNDIPIIDFKKCGLLIENDDNVEKQALKTVGAELYQAFSIYGFARLSNTGMPSEVIGNVNRRSKVFYDLPEKVKNVFHNRSLEFNYDPKGLMKVDKNGNADQSEGLMVGSPAMYDENTRWPDVPELKESMLTCADLCKKLAHRLLKALGVGMKLKDPDYFYKCHSFLNRKGNSTMFKATHYPPIPDDTSFEENSTRIGEHTDAGSITLLFHDDVRGLQVHRVVNPKLPELRKLSRQVAIYFASADSEVPLDELEFADGVKDTEKKSHEGMRMKSKEYIKKRFYDYRPDPNTL